MSQPDPPGNAAHDWPRVWIDKDRVSLDSYLRVQHPGEGGRSLQVAQLAAVMSDTGTWRALVELVGRVS